MISETFVTGLNQKLSTFSLVSFSGEAKNNNKLDPITPDRKLKFNMIKNVYKNRITLNLGKVHTKTSFSTMRNNVLNFGLLTKKKKKKKKIGEKKKKKKKTIGEKRTISQE